MDMLNWILSVMGSLFTLFEMQILGIPLYVITITVFVFGLLAKFMHGRR